MMTSVGSINEKGYLKGFKRRGYTNPKCLLELVANSLDSIDRKGGSTGLIRFDIRRNEILMSDRNSDGMNRNDIANMFDMHRENHVSDASRGVSGIGAKPSLSNLSLDRDMHLFTYREGGEYLRVNVPWASIHTEGRYTGMISVQHMTQEEIAAFGLGTGTTIVFPYSNMLRDLILNNFRNIDEDDNVLKAPLDRIGVVFGREQVQMECSDYEQTSVMSLPMYSYLSANDAEYYTGVSRNTIEHLYSEKEDNHRFIWVEKNTEIIKRGKGWAKEHSEVCSNRHGFVRVGEYTVLAGLRQDRQIFDPMNPVLPTAESKKIYNQYNVTHLGSGNTDFLAMNKLVRNGQTIGLIPIADTNIASARANGTEYCKIQLVQCEVRFNPVSTQDNRQDKFMGIQENKNQFDGNNLDLNLTRLIKAIRNEKAEEIWNYFDRTVAYKAESETESEVVSESESE